MTQQCSACNWEARGNVQLAMGGVQKRGACSWEGVQQQGACSWEACGDVLCVAVRGGGDVAMQLQCVR